LSLVMVSNHARAGGQAREKSKGNAKRKTIIKRGNLFPFKADFFSGYLRNSMYSVETTTTITQV